MHDPSVTGEPVAEADNLSIRYPGASAAAVTGLTFRAHEGARIAVLGPNGGGKTTLFRAMTGELPPASGSLRLPTRVALVPQTDRSRLDYPVSALDVALMGAVSRRSWWQRPSGADRALAEDALARVGLAAVEKRTFGDLSGGQRQRVLVARALVQDAPILLLDEPYSGLDTRSAEQLELVLDQLAADGRSLLMATHDLEQARAWDLVLCINREQIAFGAPDEVLTRQVVERTYGAAIVPLADGDERVLMPPHHHDHDHGH